MMITMTMIMILMVMIIPMLPEEIEKVLPVNPLHEYQEQINLHCYCSLRAICWLRGGVGGQFPRNLN